MLTRTIARLPKVRPIPLWIRGLALYLLCLAVLVMLIFAAPGFLGTDDYYHTRISAQIITQGRLALDFPWLPQTILSPDRFVDHHLLFHLYLAPWAYFGGIAGAKIATAGIAAGVFVAAWVLLRGIGVRYAALWAVAMFGLSTPFLYRMLMVRTQGASLLLLIVALHLLFQRRARWLVPLAFAYTWLYDGFVLLLAFAVLDMAAGWIAERRLDWQPTGYVALGIALGLIINPYFPRNVQFIAEHLGAKVAFEGGVPVGNEWYPYRTGTLLSNSAGALLALVIGVLRPGFGARRDRAEMTLLLAALLTLFMVFKSRRFIEYFPAFALLFSAAAWGRGQVKLQDWLPRWHPAVGRAAVALVPMLGAAILIGTTLADTYHDAQNAKDVAIFAGAAGWLQEHTPAGAAVFQTDWDDFTRLFYYNTHNTYLVGLDPTYLERADPALWDQWVAITRGAVAQPSAVIRSDFGASYVVSDTRHEAFAAQAEDDPAMRLVYRDQYSFVWEVSPSVVMQPGE